jgi:hypothetical protein
MWTCPECGKIFRNKNQYHSCYRLSLDDHLKYKPEHIRNTVLELVRRLEEFGPIRLNPVKSSIQVKAGATFLSIRPKKDHVEIEFQLPRLIEDFPVHRAIRISGNRVLHFVFLQDPGDVNDLLIDWLKESYRLVSKA